MVTENYSLEEQKMLKECLSNIQNIHLFEKVAFLSQPNEYQLNNDSDTSKKIDIINHNLRDYPHLQRDMLDYAFNDLVNKLDIYNDKVMPSSNDSLFKKRRQEEIILQVNKELMTWYNKMGSEWVNNHLPIDKVNTWGIKNGLEKVTKTILKNAYSLEGTSVILNSSIGKGNRELFDLAIKAGSAVNGPKDATQAFHTPLAHYPRLSAKRSRNENETIYEYMLDTLLKEGADVNKFHNSKNSYIHLSAIAGNYHQLSKLLEKGAKANNEWVQDDKIFSTVQMLKQNKKDDVVDLINTHIELQKPKQYTLKM